eukprot:COSAG04_NODE_1402_length_6917_cov_4.721473_3_plen_306_part_00
MPQVETQFFLSSEVAEEVNPGRTRFSVTLSPPLKLEGKSARLFVHSASVPYTTQNITSSNNSMVVDVGASTTTVSIAPGVYSLQDMQDALNSAVNAYMHNSGLALLTDGSGKANFVTFTPNSKLNRVEATFAHLGTGMDCSKAASTMRDVLGFDSLIGYAAPTFSVSNEQPLSLGITYVYGGAAPVSYTHNLANGEYTASTLAEVLDLELSSQNYYMRELANVDAAQVAGEQEVGDGLGGHGAKVVKVGRRLLRHDAAQPVRRSDHEVPPRAVLRVREVLFVAVAPQVDVAVDEERQTRNVRGMG